MVNERKTYHQGYWAGLKKGYPDLLQHIKSQRETIKESAVFTEELLKKIEKLETKNLSLQRENLKLMALQADLKEEREESRVVIDQLIARLEFKGHELETSPR